MRTFRYVVCGAVFLVLAACKDMLNVDNANQADRDRALGSAADLEAFIAAGYTTVHNGTLGGSNDDLQSQMQTMGLENVSTLANFAMGPRSTLPRAPIDNTRGSQGNAGNYRDFVVEHRAARIAALGMSKLTLLTLGSPARNARARAFARFVQGVALGNLALAYDSASILREDDGKEQIIPLSGYRTVMSAALGFLDSAITIASGPTPSGPATDWFPLPNTWIAGNAVSTTQFVQLARSYQARFRASVARTPAERADITAGGIVDWTKVIADANAGITTDLNLAISRTTGWDLAWVIQHFTSTAWHEMSQLILGMADTSGGFNAWLSQPNVNKVPFLVATPDKRFPGGANCLAPCSAADRTAQGAFAVPGTFASLPYFRNRPSGLDGTGDPLQLSMYDFWRSRTFFVADRIGPYPVMTAAEIRLLAAEGYLRQGNFASAITAINVSRTANGQLPPLAGIADTVTPVPGGNACVPKIPDPATNFTSAKCGNIWEALKWEYRMETAYTGYGMWYFAGRGWGDLPQGTAVHWPVPYQEMDTRQHPFYGLGGTGLPGGAAKGNYGLFLGGLY